MAASALPQPPPWYSLFDSNSDFPSPPNIPASGDTFNTFGMIVSTVRKLPTLEEQGIKRLFVSEELSEIPNELRRLNKLLLCTFMQILDNVSKPQEETQQLTERLDTTFKNIHYLLNSCREAQARQDIVQMLQTQLVIRQQLADQLKRTIQRATYVLNQIDDKDNSSIQ
ncbi:MAG: hypothetical protein EZS28_022207 [Streblomastix strix]|uniref:Mediator of RNA polymerase II transcription subunit 7 n=1 Tax=Streblomastix strix TaxID=222440 RepID=A0A5J4VIM6_9EUKA|nr:MAG: hypothetical protein EZS28_022207 [Streblomastix strix]